ncbi:unnamed protein product [Symbiodinium natans]|uniref:Uncharacterized protein n=1 Tax=Symbiodinium natans TaxID=878477 RepID=A0A812MCL3_9DINO|nr:unnamed protein product [Symbiodinium natans]
MYGVAGFLRRRAAASSAAVGAVTSHSPRTFAMNRMGQVKPCDFSSAMYGVTWFLGRRAAASDAAVGAVTSVLAQQMPARMANKKKPETTHEVAHAYMTTPGAHVQPGWSYSSLKTDETYLSQMSMETLASRYAHIPAEHMPRVLEVLAATHELPERFAKQLMLIPLTGEGIVGHRQFSLSNGKLTGDYLKYYIYKADDGLFRINMATAKASQEWQNKSDNFTVRTTSTFCGISWQVSEQEVQNGVVCLSENHQKHLAAKFEREAVQKFAGDFPQPA